MLNKQYTSVEHIQQGPKFTLAVSLESVRGRTLASHQGKDRRYLFMSPGHVCAFRRVSGGTGRGPGPPGYGEVGGGGVKGTAMLRSVGRERVTAVFQRDCTFKNTKKENETKKTEEAVHTAE